MTRTALTLGIVAAVGAFALLIGVLDFALGKAILALFRVDV